MKNAQFKQKLQEATMAEIPALWDTLQLNYHKIPSHLRSSFNQLKAEFLDQPNNFILTNWKAKLAVLIGQFPFEIIIEGKDDGGDGGGSPKQAQKFLYIIFTDLKGYSQNAGNNELLAKVKNFFDTLKDKYFADTKQHLFKTSGDGILATGHSLADMAQKALAIRNEIKNYAWKQAGFPENMNVRVALHAGEAIEHYNPDGSINDISGTAVIQAARLEPYVMVGEVFCSQLYANLLAQDKTHNLATLNLGKHNLGKTHDKFEMDIAVLFAESDKETYEEYKAEKCKKHLAEKTQKQDVEPSEIAQQYDKGGSVPPVQHITNFMINAEKIGQITQGGTVDNRGANFNL